MKNIFVRWKIGSKVFLHMFDEVALSKQNIERWYPLAENKVEETHENQAKQMLAKLALEPEWEAKFEPNSYGFRPGRSYHDAIASIFLSLRGKTRYVLDANIHNDFLVS